MKTYLVGGYVRDTIMGKIEPHDRDYVVVGATAEDMLNAGFEQVGASFPVFLHPETREEYALARTEKSTGDGYKDFTFETDGISLKEDLRRRDLTINAIAKDVETLEIFDPFDGIKDSQNYILRHVSDDGFIEDPLRVVRLARFCAKFPTFTVHPNTVNLCKLMVKNGMLNSLTVERVTAEMMKAFLCNQPTRFFYFLQMVGALESLFPEVHALTKVTAGPYLHHPEGDAFTHTMMVMDQIEYVGVSPLMRQHILFSALVHDLGKGNTKEDILPHHYGHEERGVRLVDEMCERMKIPNDFRDCGKIIARYHTHVHNVYKLNPKTIVKMYETDIKQKRHLNIIDVLVAVARMDARGRSSFYSNVPYNNASVMMWALKVCNINASDVCNEEELKNVHVLKQKLYNAQIAAVTKVMKGWSN